MNILLPFFDDSSLFLAIKLYNSFVYYKDCNILFLYISENKNLSDRQLSLLKDSYVVYKCTLKYFYDAKFLSNFDLVIYSKLPCGPFNKRKLCNADKYFLDRRPYFLSMVSGIDFTPEKGIKNRHDADGICISDDITREKYGNIIRYNQKIYKYHPYFCLDKHKKSSRNIKNIYFFTQAIIPDTLSERINILRMLITISKKYPDKNIFIKLRNVKGENKHHTHKEIFSYEDIIKIYSVHDSLPDNLKISTRTIEECLHDADFCITCTSTAGIESLCQGIPTAFYLDFSYNKSIENIIKNAKIYFQDSNLLYSKDDILKLTIREPNHMWISEKLCHRDDINTIFASVTEFTKNYLYIHDEYYKIPEDKQDGSFTILKKIEYYIINRVSPNKTKKFLLNRKKFFRDSKNILIRLYWKLLSSTFNK